MSRKTQQNKITSPELIKQINPENLDLMDGFLLYLESVQRSPNTISTYRNDLEIFFCWNLTKNKNKFFIDLSKRDFIAYQSWLKRENGNSPARIRRLKATLSSLSNYIENILDDCYPTFRNIVAKIESPLNQPVREKSIFEEEDINRLLQYLTSTKQYQKACCVALAAFSGARKSELLRYKVSYFKDDCVLYGSLYKTPEKIKTKGRGEGKYIYRYVLANEFKPYLDLWLKEREHLGVDTDDLFVKQDAQGKWCTLPISSLDSWTKGFTKFLNKDFYWHSMRHKFTTYLAKHNIPDSVITEIIGWSSVEMVSIYNDTTADENIGKYFSEEGIRQVEVGKLSNL